MPTYFLSTNHDPSRSSELERRIKQAIPDLLRISNLSDLESTLQVKTKGQVYVLIDAPTNTEKNIDDLIGIANRHRNSVLFVAISDDISATDYKRLVRSGGTDWVSTAGAPQEILDIINKRHGSPVHKGETDSTEPVVIAFVPSAGGVGNSKLASEVGVWLKINKATKDRRVCLIDLDFQTSHVCAYLDLEPKLRIDVVAKNPERLDAHLFEILKSRHATGLDVVAAPRSKFDFNELTVATLDALFDMAATRYDLILIDLPLVWFPWTFDIITNADGLIVTGTNTIPCLHQIAETIAATRSNRTDAASIAIAINRCERSIFGSISRLQHVNHILGQEKVFFVRNDPSTMVDSINTGAPLFTGYRTSRAARDIGAVASHCAQLKSRSRTNNGFG